MPIPSVDTFLKSTEFLESWGDFEKALEDPEELLNESIPSIILKCNEQPSQILPILLLFLSSQTQKDFLNFCKSIILGGDFDATLQNLQNEGKLYSRMCNVVWQQTAIAYRCMTCGLAGSSSLCVQCFKDGDHKGHQYIIYSSSFGGCCDCGNPAVWKPSGNCRRHIGKSEHEKGKAMEGLDDHPILGLGKITRVVLHFLVILLKRSIILIKRQIEEDSVDKAQTPPPKRYSMVLFVDPFANGIAKDLTIWLDQFASYSDQFRSLVSRELISNCINRLQNTNQVDLNEEPDHSSSLQLVKEEFPLTNLSPKWENDNDVTKCRNCDIFFTLFNRRSHCRGCGKIFCNKCLKKIPVGSSHYKSTCTVCSTCNQRLLLNEQKSLLVSNHQQNIQKIPINVVNVLPNSDYQVSAKSDHGNSLPSLATRDILSYQHFFHLIEKMKLLLQNEKALESQNYDLKYSMLYRIGACLPTPLCDALINLYLQLLYDDEFKEEFMLVFIDHYYSLSFWMITLSLENKKQMDDFINRITAQLWNMNEQIQRYSQCGNLDILGIIVETNLKIFIQSVGDNSTSINCNNSIISDELYWSFLTDLITVLTNKSTQLYVLEQREDIVQKWLWIMLLCSFINPITRLPKREEYETHTWRTSFTLEISVNRSYQPFFSGYGLVLGSLLEDKKLNQGNNNNNNENNNSPNENIINNNIINNNVIIDSKREVVSFIKARVGLITKLLLEYFQSTKMELEIANQFIIYPFKPKAPFRFPSPSLVFLYPYGYDNSSILPEDQQTIENFEQNNGDLTLSDDASQELAISNFNMMKDKVTFHILIHRILAGFIEKTCASTQDVSLSSILDLGNLPKYFLTLLIEHPLRLCALVAQVRSGLWIYNGGTIITQVMLYHKNACCYDDLYDFDILLLQSVSILMGSYSFSAIALNRFQIQLPTLENYKEMRSESLAMLDEYFQFIIIIIMQRSKSGQTEEMQILHDLIHRLCLEDQTYSQLENFVCTRLGSNSKFESLLKSISVYHSASGYSEGRYSLKPEYWKYFDPYFSHYLPREKQNALENYLNYLRSNNLLSEKGIIPTPFFSPVYSQFRRIYSLAYNDINLSIYFATLKNYIVHKNHSYDNLLYSVLYLLQICILSTEQTKFTDDSNAIPFVPQPENYYLLDKKLRKRIYKSNLVSSEDPPSPRNFESILDLLIKLYKEEIANNNTNYQPNIKSLLMQLSTRSNKTKILISSEIPNFFTGDVEIDNTIKMEQDKKKVDYKSRQAEMLAKIKLQATQSFLKMSQEFSDDLDDDDMEDESEIRKSNSYPFLQVKFTQSTEEVEEEEEEEQLQQIDCALCRDSINQDKFGYLRNYNQSKRTIAMCGLLQRSNLLKVVRNYERDSEIRNIDFLNIDINNEIDKRSKKRVFDIIPKMKLSRSKFQPALHQAKVATPDRSDALNQSTPSASLGESNDTRKKKSEAEKKKSRDEILIKDGNEEEVIDIRFCGHYVHVDCLFRYFRNLCSRHESNNDYEGRRIISLQNGEFICPSCRRLNNCAVPLLSRSSSSILSFPLFSFRKTFPRHQHVFNHEKFKTDKKWSLEYLMEIMKKKVKEDQDLLRSHIYEDASLIENPPLPSTPILSELTDTDDSANNPENLNSNNNNTTSSNGSENANANIVLSENPINDAKPTENKNVPPSSPVPAPMEITNTTNYFVDTLSVLINRSWCSDCLMDNKVGNLVYSNISSLWLLLNERISSLEIQFRSHHTSNPSNSFLKFLKSHQNSEILQDLTLTRLATFFSTQSDKKMDDLAIEIEQKIWKNVLLFSCDFSSSSCSLDFEFDFEVMNEDIFNIFFTLICAKGCALSVEYFFTALQIMYCFYILQIMFSLSSDLGDRSITDWVFDSLENNEKLEKEVEETAIPFLRKALILFILLFDGKFNIDQVSEEPQTEFSQLIDLLRLPSVSCCIRSQNSTFLSCIVKTLLSPTLNELKNDQNNNNSHINKNLQSNNNNNNNDNNQNEENNSNAVESIVETITVGDIQLLSQKNKRKLIVKPIPFSLSNLPHLFQEVYQNIATQVCNICKEITLEPGLCLLCGEFICGGIKHINELSAQLPPQLKSSLNAFVTHAEICGGGTGLFLMLKLCTILLFRTRRVSIWNSLYLDDHGEEDIELRRGKALYLNELRLNQLQNLYLTQSFDHDTRILDKTKQLGI